MDDKSMKPLSKPADMLESSSPAPAASQTPTPARKPPIPVQQRSVPKKLIDSAASSKNASPRPSREPSPARNSSRSTGIPRTGPRSSKGSSQDPSPSRSASGNNMRTNAPDVPSSAAIQRALSAANTPALKPSYSDSAILTAGPSKAGVPSETKETPRWPISPRLRSPPPVNKIRSKDDLPSLTSLRFQSSNESSQSTSSGEADQEENQTPTGSTALKSPARGPSTSSTTLETVQEISQPVTPVPTQMDGTNEEQNPIDLAVLNKNPKAKTKQADKVDSGSESGEKKSEVKLKPTASGVIRPTIVPALKSAASGTFKKPSEGSSTKNMTVETETVSSVPIVAVGGGATINGSIRAKPSSETIRPKKEKKKTTRKQQSIAAGAGEHAFANPISPFSQANSTGHGRLRSKSRLHDHPVLPSRYQSERGARAREMSTSRERSRGWESSDSSRTFTTPAAELGSDLGHGHRYDHYQNYGELQARGENEATRPDTIPPFLCSSGNRLQGSRLSSVSGYVRNLLTHPSTTASSKADIFEAKIASAVDEADSEDSEETFVYESNPPDHERPRRYHSRTPSTTSMASAIDQQRNRSIHPGLAGGVREEGTHSVHGKKSMKFANSFSQQGGEAADDEAVRNGTGRGTIRHHHIGRWGRSGPAGAGPNGHQSLFDNESPFPNAKNSKFGGTNSRQGSRPSSPRIAGNSKFGRRMIGPYDDEGDDERTPLIPSSIRSARSGRHRRPYSGHSSVSQTGRGKQSLLARFASCLVLSVLVLLVLTGAIGFLFATTQPLLEVRITGLKKVLASEGELMFDVEIEARNPNCLGVSVEGASLSVYARSKYANGAGDGWFSGGGGWVPANRMRRRGPRIGALPSSGKVLGEFDANDEVLALDDSPFDPLPSDPGDDDKRPLLLLGRITQFDNALYFEGSPFRHTHSYSTGEIRIENPGNVTGGASGEEGMERWREVVRHEWDLIIQGLIRYELPLSRRIRSSQVRGRISVAGGGQESSAGDGEGDLVDGDLVDGDAEIVELEA